MWDGGDSVWGVLNALKPLCSQLKNLLWRNIGRYREYGIGWVVEVAIEVAYLLLGSLLDVVGRKTYGSPTVGVGGIDHVAQKHILVTVGLVEVSLTELLYNHTLLYLDSLRREVETRHAVAFEP